MYLGAKYHCDDESHSEIRNVIYYCNVIVDRTTVVAKEIRPHISIHKILSNYIFNKYIFL
jgi:hypothetical protein